MNFPCLIFFLLATVMQLPAQNSFVEVAVFRFRSSDKKLLLRPANTWVKTPGPSFTAYLGQLQKIGSASVLFRTNQPLSSTATNSIKFLEAYPLRAAGRTEALGEAVALDIQLVLTLHQLRANRALGWSGTIRWSPEMLDYLSGKPSSFLMPFTGATDHHVVTNSASLGRSVLDLCKTAVFSEQSAPIIELPICKTASFEGSVIPKQQNPILQSVIFENGGLNAQAIVLYLKPGP